ncbi:hypothetical protein B566_EDAN004054 [Ephemera danica]|nr:hypothetical protein B566_EDAN004054 [Ephemera danica]
MRIIASKLKINFSQLQRTFSTTQRFDKDAQICVVGAGPAGFYVAQHLTKALPEARIDIFDRWPVPFGLVRFGVAPDHPEVKNVINTFTKTARNPRVRFVGNVCLGKDVSLTELQRCYHAVVLTYGAEQDRQLGLPGENLDNIISARSFVGWYNGVPGDENLPVNLDTDTAVILGQGNVALDVARLLLSPVDALKATDITAHAIEALSRSKVKRVLLVGRRGPLQAAFTIKELREMLKLPNCRTVFKPSDFTGVREALPGIVRPRKRLTELLVSAALDPPSEEQAQKWQQAERSFEPVFLRNPAAFVPSSSVPGAVGGVRLNVTRLVGEVGENQTAEPTGEFQDIACGLALRSIGYKSIAADPDIPFDSQKGVINNSIGRVKGLPGVYCSGWVSTGPVGVLVSTMGNAFDLGRLLVKDLSDGSLQCDKMKPGFKEIARILDDKGVQHVSFSDWERIDAEEQRRGNLVGKPREKIIAVKEMLKIASDD